MMEEEEVIKQGFLTRFTEKNRWKVSWFILKGGVLSFYENMWAINPQGTFFLSDCVVTEKPFSISSPDAKRAVSSGFELRTTNASLLLIPQNKEELTGWIEAIQQASNAKRKPDADVKPVNQVDEETSESSESMNGRGSESGSIIAKRRELSSPRLETNDKERPLSQQIAPSSRNTSEHDHSDENSSDGEDEDDEYDEEGDEEANVFEERKLKGKVKEESLSDEETTSGTIVILPEAANKSVTTIRVSLPLQESPLRNEITENSPASLATPDLTLPKNTSHVSSKPPTDRSNHTDRKPEKPRTREAVGSPKHSKLKKELKLDIKQVGKEIMSPNAVVPELNLSHPILENEENSHKLTDSNEQPIAFHPSQDSPKRQENKLIETCSSPKLEIVVTPPSVETKPDVGPTSECSPDQVAEGTESTVDSNSEKGNQKEQANATNEAKQEPAGQIVDPFGDLESEEQDQPVKKKTKKPSKKTKKSESRKVTRTFSLGSGSKIVPSPHHSPNQRHSGSGWKTRIMGGPKEDVVISKDYSRQELTSVPAEVWKNKRITILNLYLNLLKALPPDIGKLTNLKQLGLNENLLKALPKEIGKLRALEILDLRSNRLKMLPPSIKRLTNLKKLFLRTNKLTSLPNELGCLISLELFSFRNNSITSLPDSLGKLTSLKVLDANQNQLKELPTSIGQLQDLIELNVSCNHLSEIPPTIGQLSKLQRLHIGFNHVTSFPTEMGNLIELQEFDAESNSLKSLLPEAIGGMTALTRLYLSRNKLESLPNEMGRLVNLRELYLQGNQLKELPKTFRNLVSLKQLDLGANHFSIFPDAELLANLNILILNDNQLSSLPPSISILTQLRTLNLGENRLESLPNEFCQLTALTDLKLMCNELTTLPAAITLLQKLKTLILDQNCIEELIPEIGQLGSLHLLSLIDNKLNDLPDDLVKLRSLGQLKVDGNPLKNISVPVIGGAAVFQHLLKRVAKARAAKTSVIEGGSVLTNSDRNSAELIQGVGNSTTENVAGQQSGQLRNENATVEELGS